MLKPCVSHTLPAPCWLRHGFAGMQRLGYDETVIDHRDSSSRLRSVSSPEPCRQIAAAASGLRPPGTELSILPQTDAGSAGRQVNAECRSAGTRSCLRKPATCAAITQRWSRWTHAKQHGIRLRFFRLHRHKPHGRALRRLDNRGRVIAVILLALEKRFDIDRWDQLARVAKSDDLPTPVISAEPASNSVRSIMAL